MGLMYGLRTGGGITEMVEQHDYVIIGAGPGGLQMGQHLARAGRSYVILESGDRAGFFFTRFPRHRRLLSINKRFNWFPEPEFNMRHDWNSLLSDDEGGPLFSSHSELLYPDADAMVAYLGDYARHHSLDVRYGRAVCRVERTADGGFEVEDARGGTYRCRRLLAGTGAVAPRRPTDVEGIEHASGYYDHELGPDCYRGKRVAIIGRGNSAFEVADHLAGDAAIVHLFTTRPVKHAWSTHYPGDLRAINNTILDMYQLKSLHATLGFRLKAIRPRSDGALDVVAEEEYPHWDPPRVGQVTLVYDHVIHCTGWNYADVSIFEEDCRPELDERGKYPRLSSTWESTVPGLYYIGTAMQSIDRKAASSFIHGFRYNVRTLFHILQERDHAVPYPGRSFTLDTDDDLATLAELLVRRVSTTAALYQQFGFLCDVLVLERSRARLLLELPVSYVHDQPSLWGAQDLIVLTLEYGFHRYPHDAPTLDFIHPADPAKPRCSAYLHPVLRHYRRGELIDEMELGESLVVRYDHYDYAENNPRAHVNSVRSFIEAVTARQSVARSTPVYTPEAERQVLRPWPADRPLPEPWSQEDSECRFARE